MLVYNTATVDPLAPGTLFRKIRWRLHLTADAPGPALRATLTDTTVLPSVQEVVMAAQAVLANHPQWQRRLGTELQWVVVDGRRAVNINKVTDTTTPTPSQMFAALGAKRVAEYVAGMVPATMGTSPLAVLEAAYYAHQRGAPPALPNWRPLLVPATNAEFTAWMMLGKVPVGRTMPHVAFERACTACQRSSTWFSALVTFLGIVVEETTNNEILPTDAILQDVNDFIVAHRY